MAGIVTCTLSQFRDTDLGLAFVVQAPMALVLDQPDLEQGGILGVLCAGDVAVPSEMEPPWLSLAAGGFVRHAKVRGGRVKLQAPGWMVTQHKDFGVLLAPHSMEAVERSFSEGSFLKLPFVKLPGQPPEAAATGSAPREPAPSERPVASNTSAPSRPPASRSAPLPPGAPPPLRAAPPARAAPPRDNEPPPPPELNASPLDDPRGQVKLTRASACDLLGDLLRGYTSEAFQSACRRLDASWTEAHTRAGRVDDVDALCLEMLLGSVIERYGFPPTAAGMREVTAAVVALAQSHAEVMERHRGIQRLLFRSFPNCFGDSVAGGPGRSAGPAPEATPATEASRSSPPSGEKSNAATPSWASAPAALPVPEKGTKSSSTRPERRRIVRLEAEAFRDHLVSCGAAHYKVVHRVVFVRDGQSTAAAQLAVCYKDNVICTSVGDDVTTTAEGEWVSCSPGSKFWRSPNAAHPEWLLGEKALHGFILTHHRSHGQLITPYSFKDLVQDAASPTGSKGWSQDESSAEVAAKLGEAHLAIHADRAGRVNRAGSGSSRGFPDSPAGFSSGDLQAGTMPTAGMAATDVRERSPGSSPAPSPTFAPAAAMLPSAVPEIAPDLSDVAHWIVEAANLNMLAEPSDRSRVLFSFERGDALVLPDAADLQLTGLRCWLALPIGVRLCRSGHWVPLPEQGGFVVAMDDRERCMRESKSTVQGVVLQIVTGCGEPWVVMHDQVVVRSGPSTKTKAVGLLAKGDILGVKRMIGDWAELVRDSNVRMKVKAGIGTMYAVNEIRTMGLEPVRFGGKFRYESFVDASSETSARPGTEMWMMVRHPEFGQMLRPCGKWRGGFDEHCAVAEERLAIYRSVVDLCHRRIFEDNLYNLWEGNLSKIPPPSALEAKLFHPAATVVRATVAGKFAGGAIIRQFSVRSYGGESGINVGMASAQQSHHRPGTSQVGYVDDCAAELGTHAGTAIWQAVSKMEVVCVACHSILLEGTVHFWQARGMRRYDPANRASCEEFAAAILMRTHGTVKLELADLQKALPPSNLPLFVWICKGIGEIESTVHRDYIFSPDCPEDEQTGE